MDSIKVHQNNPHINFTWLINISRLSFVQLCGMDTRFWNVHEFYHPIMHKTLIKYQSGRPLHKPRLLNWSTCGLGQKKIKSILNSNAVLQSRLCNCSLLETSYSIIWNFDIALHFRMLTMKWSYFQNQKIQTVWINSIQHHRI